MNSRVQKAALDSIARAKLAFRVDNQVQVESEIEKEPPGRHAARWRARSGPRAHYA